MITFEEMYNQRIELRIKISDYLKTMEDAEPTRKREYTDLKPLLRLRKTDIKRDITHLKQTDRDACLEMHFIDTLIKEGTIPAWDGYEEYEHFVCVGCAPTHGMDAYELHIHLMKTYPKVE